MSKVKIDRGLPLPRLAIVGKIAALLLLVKGGTSEAQPLDPEFVEQIRIEQKLGERLPLDLVFTDENGAPVTLGKFFGDKPVVLSLAYYDCPMLCTQVLNGLVRSLRVLKFDIGNEFEVLTVSFDPTESHELAAAKKDVYLRRYGREGAASGWHFLTGTQEQIDKLTEAVGFRYERDDQTGEFIHASGIMVLTPEGTLARYHYGIEYAPKDLQLSLIESAKHEIGTAVDELLLLCYQYDPKTGKYGFAIMNSLRIGGLATVVTIGAFVVVMLRRDRRDTTKESYA